MKQPIIHYYLLEVKSEQEVIHSEIVKISSVDEDTSRPLVGLAGIMLNTLHARDSMSAMSRVRPIRERMDGIRTENFATDISNEPDAAERYEAQQANRDHHKDGRIFDDVLRATSNILW